MVIVAGFVYIVLFFAIAIRHTKFEASYGTITIFGLGAFLYYIAIPMELSLRNMDSFVLSGVAYEVSPDLQLKIVAMGTMALVAFAAGYKFTGFAPFQRPADKSVQLHDYAPAPIPKHLYILTAASIALLLVFYQDDLQGVSSYEGHYTIAYSVPVFSVLTELAVIGLAMIAAMLVCRRTLRARMLAILLVGLIVAWGIYSSDKDPLLLGLLAIGSTFVQRRGRFQFRVLLGIVVVILVSGPLVELFSAYRADVELTADNVRLDGVMLDRDPTGPLVSLIETVEDRTIEHRYGQTFLDGIILLIPRSVWPDRPLDLSEQFVRERLGNRWKAGMGMGYSLLAESFLNFGWFGPLIQYLFLGLLWGYGWRSIQTYCERTSHEYWQALYCSVGYYTLIIMHRAPFSFPVKHTVIVIAALFAVDRISRSRQPRNLRIALGSARPSRTAFTRQT